MPGRSDHLDGMQGQAPVILLQEMELLRRDETPRFLKTLKILNVSFFLSKSLKKIRTRSCFKIFSSLSRHQRMPTNMWSTNE